MQWMKTAHMDSLRSHKFPSIFFVPDQQCIYFGLDEFMAMVDRVIEADRVSARQNVLVECGGLTA